MIKRLTIIMALALGLLLGSAVQANTDAAHLQLAAAEDRQDRRQERGRSDERQDRRDCRQDEGRVGKDKRDCKQEEVRDGVRGRKNDD